MKRITGWLSAAALLLVTPLTSVGANLSLPDAPLFVPGQNIAPLVMLVMGRDHTLYYEAYNDATDLDGDNVLDTYFRPVANEDGAAIRYYGYFDIDKCYKYESNIFVPTGITSSGKCKTEGGEGRWSGNFLNYLTTSRVDALRKVLYGGMRQSDSSNTPVLERAYIPQDAHGWGKTWNPKFMNTSAKGNLLLSDYSDLDDSYGYLFANTSLMGSANSESSTNPPLLRVLKLTSNMALTSESLSSVTTLYYSGSTNSWGKTAMTSLGNGKWQINVTLNGSSSFQFYANPTISQNGNVGNDGTWLGDSSSMPDGIAETNSSNIKSSLSGSKWIIFNANTYRYTISDTAETASSFNPLTDARYLVWNWLSKESPVAGSTMVLGSGTVSVAPTDYNVRVRVCASGLLESNCKAYTSGSGSSTNYFPVGLLQNYGEGDAPKMYFGLLTGSYKNNTQGGVLRAKIGKIDDEVVPTTGKFKTRTGATNGPGIIATLNKLRVTQFNTSRNYSNCGWVTTRAINNGECTSWGNPIAEMLYESLRYFAGAKTPSSAFTVGSGDELSLPEDSWDDPFALTDGQGQPQCAKPVNLVISDVGTSYDSDQLPGSAFASYSGNLPTNMAGLNVSTWTQTISSHEGVNGKLFFIGQVLGQDNAGIPSAKNISTLAGIRGLAPMEPTKQGSYYAAGLAYYGHQTDVNPRSGSQKPQTVVVAMASHLPQIKIRASGKVITLIPFAKSVGGYQISSAQTAFQPTNTIVDFYVQSISETEGLFRVNYEDVEQGADHDMDMIVRYHYKVLDNGQLSITLSSEYAAGGIKQHAGYVISGTTADGVYLDVRDQDTGASSDVAYYLDTALATDAPYPNNARNLSSNTTALPLERTRTFSVNTSSTASTADYLPSPLWYAAKWGSFVDVNGNGVPDTTEWDEDGDGEPDNYFLVTNANNLESQLQSALDGVSDLARSATSVSYTSSELTSDSQAFIATFEAKDWSGDLIAYPISSGVMQATPSWKANTVLTSQGESNRIIYTMDSDGSKRLFTAPTSLTGSSSGLSQAQITALLAGYPTNSATTYKLSYVQTLVNYLRGNRTYESDAYTVPGLGTAFRERNGLLGDNVHSSPAYGVSAGDGVKFVIFGANDGMVHVLNATTGREIFAYIPSTSYANLYSLASKDYNHKYFVDGTIKIVNATVGSTSKTIAVGTFGLGARGAWALDLTNLSDVSNSQSSAQSHLLWELTSSASTSIGFIPNAPAITSLGSGGNTTWLAIFGNGYNATDSNGEGALLVVNLLTGALEKTLLTGVKASNDPTGANRSNAVTEPVIADSNLDGVGDYLYSGDLFGNVWKVDITGSDLSSWKFITDIDGSTDGSTPKPLFKAVSREGTAQPITVRPSVARHPDSGLLVFVGTGKYVEASDTSVVSQPTQTVYGIWDKPGRTADFTRETMLEQTLENENTSVIPHQRETSKNLIDWSVHDGWYLDLYYDGSNNGERINYRILVTNSTAAITSMIPSDDICSGGGRGWYMEVDIYSGSNDGLVENSMELERLPSEPVYKYAVNSDGDYVAGKTIVIDGGEVVNTPTSIIKTGMASWQMLY